MVTITRLEYKSRYRYVGYDSDGKKYTIMTYIPIMDTPQEIYNKCGDNGILHPYMIITGKKRIRNNNTGSINMIPICEGFVLQL